MSGELGLVLTGFWEPWDLLCCVLDLMVHRFFVGPSSRGRRIHGQPALHHCAEPAPWWWLRISQIWSSFCLTVGDHWPPESGPLPGDRRVNAASADNCSHYYYRLDRMLGGFVNLKTLQRLLWLFCDSALEVKNLHASWLVMGESSSLSVQIEIVTKAIVSGTLGCKKRSVQFSTARCVHLDADNGTDNVRAMLNGCSVPLADWVDKLHCAMADCGSESGKECPAATGSLSWRAYRADWW